MTMHRRLLHVSDLHSHNDDLAAFARGCYALCRVHDASLLVTGDLTNNGAQDELDAVLAVLGSPDDVVMLGNHDIARLGVDADWDAEQRMRTAFCSWWPATEWCGKLLTLDCLDACGNAAAGAYLPAHDRAIRLVKPSVVALHHDPRRSNPFDPLHLRDGERLLRTCDEVGVWCIACGHVGGDVSIALRGRGDLCICNAEGSIGSRRAILIDSINRRAEVLDVPMV
jgi:hypothetical protein